MKMPVRGYCKRSLPWYVFARIKPAHTACGVCVDSCPAGVLELQDVADEDSCVARGARQDACAAGAITEIAVD